jgi:tripartite ATP-independent transporter DctP family solute receptor
MNASMKLMGIAAALGVASFVAHPASAQTVMKIAYTAQADGHIGKGMQKFAEIVEKNSQGAIKVQLFPNGVLGTDRQTMEQLQMGTIHGNNNSTGPVATFVPRVGVFDLPFLFTDRKKAYEVLDGPIGQELLDKELPKAGFIGLCYLENGFRNLTNSKREIDTLDLMKGIKIRTMDNRLHVDLWNTLGVNGTPMDITQVYSAMEQHVIDGQENPVNIIQANKYNEVQKYMALTRHVYSAQIFLISKVWFDKLSDKDKQIIKAAAIETRDYQRKIAEQMEKDGLDYLKSKGMIITELKPGEKEKIQAMLKPFYDKYKQQIGAELVDKVLAAVK